MKRNLHAGRGRREGVGAPVFTTTSARTSTSPRSRCSPRPASTSKTSRRGRSSRRQAATRKTSAAWCASPRTWWTPPSRRRRPSCSSVAATPKTTSWWAATGSASPNFGEAPFLIDPYTGEPRPATKSDIGDAARLCDAMSEVDVFDMALNASRRAPRDRRHPPRRGGPCQHHQVRLRRHPLTGGVRGGLGPGGGDRRGSRGAAAPPHRLRGRLPGEPLAVAPRVHRPDDLGRPCRRAGGRHQLRHGGRHHAAAPSRRPGRAQRRAARLARHSRSSPARGPPSSTGARPRPWTCATPRPRWAPPRPP